MSENQSADEIRAASIAAMPPGLGELHYELYTELAWAYLRLNEYKELFGDLEAIATLNDTAPRLFGGMQRTLWEALLMHLCRMTDREVIAGKQTLTIRRIPAIIPDIRFRAEVKSLVTAAVDATSFAREWRNRRLAHTELPSQLSVTAVPPLAGTTRIKVESALAAIVQVLNSVQIRYMRAETYYEGVVTLAGGVSALLHYLRLGKQAQDEEDAKLRRLVGEG